MKHSLIRLNALLFWEGFLSLAFQMLAIRQLLYVSGGTILETSMVVSFFLLALARGYQVGGLPVASPVVRLARNLLLAAVASLTFTPWISAFLFTGGYGPGMVLYIGFGVIPIAYFMGQSLPLLVQAQTYVDSAGREPARYAGDGLGMSTYGSFLGALVVPLAGFTLLGVGATHVCLVLAAVMISAAIGNAWYRVAGLATLTVAFVLSERHFEGLVVEHRGAYGDTQIVDTPDGRLWISNRLIMSRKSPDGGYAWYVNQWRDWLQEGPDARVDVLVLGAAGFTVSEGLPERYNFTYVDIDPLVEPLAREHFVAPRDERLIVDDARRYVMSSKERFDRILLDVYSASKGIPEHLLTTEFLSALSQRINSRGEVWINSIRHRDLADRYARRLHATIVAVFPFCDTFIKPDSARHTNVLYRCQVGSATPYTDDRTSAAIDAALMGLANE